MRLIGEVLEERFGADAAGEVPVLYGGSVNATNVRSYTAVSACSGCLVGGASLKPAEFSAMIAAVAGDQA
jgi:triosephosphate isomerase